MGAEAFWVRRRGEVGHALVGKGSLVCWRFPGLAQRVHAPSLGLAILSSLPSAGFSGLSPLSSSLCLPLSTPGLLAVDGPDLLGARAHAGDPGS